MTKSILCALDIAEDAPDQGILEKAAALAALDSAQLDVVAVVPDFGVGVVGGFFGEDHHEKALAATKEKLSDFVASKLGAEANDKVRHVVATGKPYQEILKVAEAAGTDLIVIGAHAPELGDFLLGPNAARVVRHSRCSVYVVR